MGLVFQALFSSCCCSLVGWAISDMRASVFRALGGFVEPSIFWVGLAGRVKIVSEFERAGLLEHTNFFGFRSSGGQNLPRIMGKKGLGLTHHYGPSSSSDAMPCLSQ